MGVVEVPLLEGGPRRQALEYLLAKVDTTTASVDFVLHREGLEYSIGAPDFVIKCGSHEHKVHKCVISTHSEYFSTLLQSKFGESNSGVITLKAVGEDEDDTACDDPEAVRLMVEYFYTLDYKAEQLDDAGTGLELGTSPVTTGLEIRYSGYNNGGRRLLPSIAWLPEDTNGNMVMHAKVFAVATKYMIPALATLAASRFADAVKVNWRHVSFPQAIRIAYTTTSDDVRDLRDTVVETISNYPVLLNEEAIAGLIRSISSLSFDLAPGSLQLPRVRAVRRSARCLVYDLHLH